MLKHIVALTLSLCTNPARALDRCYEQDLQGRQRRFVISDGEATDTKTGLVWKRCGLGTDWRSPLCVGARSTFALPDAEQRAQQLGSDWRVPSGPELQTILDPNCGKPVVDPSVFPDVQPDAEGAAPYWTTNPVGMAGLYYFFDFMDASSDGHSRGFPLNVRLVRSGIPRSSGK